tara:strand:+ start:214 stop:711 length:498 start_codon:yes stop_codon:yes gene_type:complete
MSRVRSQNQKKFNFKSSGQSINTEIKYRQDTFRKKLIGIKTPLELGSGRDGMLKMHDNLKNQIKDNLKNLLLTNHGERLGNYNFGANLDELLFELTGEDFEAEALARISTAIGRFMPFVSVEGFETFTESFNNEHTAKIGITLRYGIPQLDVSNQIISLILRVAG